MTFSIRKVQLGIRVTILNLTVRDACTRNSSTRFYSFARFAFSVLVTSSELRYQMNVFREMNRESKVVTLVTTTMTKYNDDDRFTYDEAIVNVLIWIK